MNQAKERNNEQKETKLVGCLCEKGRCLWAMAMMSITRDPLAKEALQLDPTYECRQLKQIVAISVPQVEQSKEND
jgi:hypothetical protein